MGQYFQTALFVFEFQIVMTIRAQSHLTVATINREPAVNINKYGDFSESDRLEIMKWVDTFRRSQSRAVQEMYAMADALDALSKIFGTKFTAFAKDVFKMSRYNLRRFAAFHRLLNARFVNHRGMIAFHELDRIAPEALFLLTDGDEDVDVIEEIRTNAANGEEVSREQVKQLLAARKEMQIQLAASEAEKEHAEQRYQETIANIQLENAQLRESAASASNFAVVLGDQRSALEDENASLRKQLNDLPVRVVEKIVPDENAAAVADELKAANLRLVHAENANRALEEELKKARTEATASRDENAEEEKLAQEIALIQSEIDGMMQKLVGIVTRTKSQDPNKFKLQLEKLQISLSMLRDQFRHA